MSKYYAVAKGRKTGIFRSWNETKLHVNGYPNAKYKSFKKSIDAQNYLSNVTIKKDKKRRKLDYITAYTDGSCVNKIGGWGFVLIENHKETPVSGKVPIYPTTNQYAELYAIYSTILYVINNKDIKNGLTIYTDSIYSIGCLTKWNKNWVKNGWVNSKGLPVVNKELIQSILNISTELTIKYYHVKAHNGDKYNEWADKLANNGRLQEYD